jgi:methylmalonyl-CoA/ethylmalonyl-CoA epimerase
MHIDHVAVAVRSVEAAADRLCALLGYHRKTVAVTNTRQRVNVLFLAKAQSLDIKLIEPAGADSPLWDFVRKGGGLHHVCFKVADVTAACDEAAAAGARVLAAPAPGEAFDNHLIGFCYLGLGLNVEFIDTDIRRGLVEATGAREKGQGTRENDGR